MSLQPLSPADVEAAFAARGLSIHIRFFEESTATSQQAADAIGCELGQIVKSLAFIVEGQPILVLASGDQRIDDRKIAEQYSVGRKKVGIATPEQCLEIYGYLPGGVPPLGHRTPNLPIWIDRSLERFEQLYAAAGAHNSIFPIALKDLVAVTGGQVADLAREVPAE
jgi:prolyl-tRNA editing enzyme YbaK/EbsC (Cys-tRNA(Pro) deacylase)